MVKTKDIFWREFVVVEGILCMVESCQFMHEVYAYTARTILNIRRLLEGCNLNQREAVLGEVLVRNAYSCLQPLLRVSKLLAL